jgi:hypothetical protein
MRGSDTYDVPILTHVKAHRDVKESRSSDDSTAAFAGDKASASPNPIVLYADMHPVQYAVHAEYKGNPLGRNQKR